MHRLLICPPDASSLALWRHVQWAYCRRSHGECACHGFMVYDTVTDMIGGMPGNLTPLQLSQHVGGDTRVYCVVPATIFDMRFPDTPSTCHRAQYIQKYNGRGEKKGGGMPKYEHPGFWPVSTNCRRSIGQGRTQRQGGGVEGGATAP
jgi:hypothetical protein